MNHPAFRITTLALTTAAALACAITLPTDAHAQRRSAQGATGGTPNAPVRRGAPGSTLQPLTTVSIALGSALYSAKVDADCHIDQRASPGSTRAYFVVMYPWFGQRPAADQPQWHLNLDVRRGARADSYDQFTFSFVAASKSGIIQTVAGSARMGSGGVRVTRRNEGARFEIEGRSHRGETVRATIDCPNFQKTEGVSS